jgi:hypothetical protein
MMFSSWIHYFQILNPSREILVLNCSLTVRSRASILCRQNQVLKSASNALATFADDVSIPDTLVCNFATEQTGQHSDIMKLIRRFNIRLRIAEKGRGTTQNAKAKTEIREVKSRWKS